MNYFSSLLRKSVDGIVMNSVAVLTRNEQKQLAGSGVPIVLLQEAPGQRSFSTVVPDNFHGGYLAGSYLAKLRHRKIAHLTARGRLGNLAQRARGFLKGVQSVCAKNDLIDLHGPHSFQGGYEMAGKLLSQHRGVTAVFAANDVIALGVIRAIHEAGLRIPNDISLVGFDDIEFASIANPALTTIAVPKYEIGRAAIEVLIKLANDRNGSPEHRRFDVKLVERESCRPEFFFFAIG